MRNLKFWVLSLIAGCACGWLLAVTWQRVRPKTVQEQVGECIADLKSPDWETRDAAVGALQKLGPDGGAAVPALIEALKDDRGSLSSRAIFALGNIGPAAASAAPAIAEHLRDDNALLPPDADLVLSEMGPDASLAAPRLTELLKDSKESTRELAAHSLSRIGFAAIPAAPALAAALQDIDNEVRINADTALSNIAANIRDSPRFAAGSAAKKAAAQWVQIKTRPRAASGKPNSNADLRAETLTAAWRLGQAIRNNRQGR